MFDNGKSIGFAVIIHFGDEGAILKLSSGFLMQCRYGALKVVEKENAVEAWAVVNRNAEIVALSPDGRFKDEALPPHSLLKVIKLTGII